MRMILRIKVQQINQVQSNSDVCQPKLPKNRKITKIEHILEPPPAPHPADPKGSLLHYFCISIFPFFMADLTSFIKLTKMSFRNVQAEKFIF